MSKTFEAIGQNSRMDLYRLETEPFGTNAYLLICRETGESVLIDTPGEAAAISERLKDRPVKYILITHGHMDHLMALEEIKQNLGAPVAAHENDTAMLPIRPDRLLADGDQVSFGKNVMEVIHTPGHTAGSICFRLDGYLIAGDTIFPGGPGKTATADDFKTLVDSISEKILVLPEQTVILPGHGASTTVKKERALFEKFRSRKHDSMLCGDVTWL